MYGPWFANFCFVLFLFWFVFYFVYFVLRMVYNSKCNDCTMEAIHQPSTTI